MTGVNGMATWLRAQMDAREQELAEDERVAQAAAGGYPRWRALRR